MSSENLRPFCFGLNVFRVQRQWKKSASDYTSSDIAYVNVFKWTLNTVFYIDRYALKHVQEKGLMKHQTTCEKHAS